jgi:hypothetical protein
VAGGLVDHFNDSVVNWAGNAADGAANWASNAATDVGDTLDSVTPWDGVAPW